MKHLIILCLFIFSTNSIGYCDSTTCVPKCRPEFICKNGECISKCNPPCPTDMICGGELGCITKDQYGDLTETHYGKIMLTSLMTLAGLGITIIGITVKENNVFHISKQNISAAQIAGPCIIAVSIPLNLFTWNKFLKAKKFREKNNLQPR
jgi:hypothetical protein